MKWHSAKSPLRPPAVMPFIPFSMTCRVQVGEDDGDGIYEEGSFCTLGFCQLTSSTAMVQGFDHSRKNVWFSEFDKKPLSGVTKWLGL